MPNCSRNDEGHAPTFYATSPEILQLLQQKNSGTSLEVPKVGSPPGLWVDDDDADDDGDSDGISNREMLKSLIILQCFQ